MSNCTDLNLDFSRVNTAIYFPVLNFWKCHKRVYVRILWKTELVTGVVASKTDRSHLRPTAGGWVFRQVSLSSVVPISVYRCLGSRHLLYDHFFVLHHEEAALFILVSF